MAGHNKWSKIQHKKGKNDKARSNLFTKLLRAIVLAAQQGGGDPAMNFSLRLAIEKAKAGNVPKDNIERAIKKGTGELKDGAKIEEVTYEGFGPKGVALVIETMTDNTNRTVSEVKHVLTKHGGSLGGPGSVMWQFVHKGVVRISNEQLATNKERKDELELALMDAGMEEMNESEFGLEIVCPKDQFQQVLEVVEKDFDITPDDSQLEWLSLIHI